MAGKTEDMNKLHCSFCGKTQDQVKKLIAGPNVYICDECIDLCSDIIEEEYDVLANKDENFNVPKPKEIKETLDEYVIGQSLSLIHISIDALSVGFTIAEYDFFLALLEALIIAMVTFVICLCGLHIGKKVGVKLAGKANILGGVILIFIGLEIFVTGVFL